MKDYCIYSLMDDDDFEDYEKRHRVKGKHQTHKMREEAKREARKQKEYEKGLAFRERL